MKERKAATIGSEPPPQVIPTADLMHRFMLDEFLQDDGRRVPIDSLDIAESRD